MTDRSLSPYSPDDVLPETDPSLLMTFEEYLRCSGFEPDAEYVDDHVEERVGFEWDHSRLQGEVSYLLGTKERSGAYLTLISLRVRVASRRVRIPDVCLLRASAPRERIPETPPLLCIEILCPEDRISRNLVRVNDFLTMGVPEVWLIDPDTRTVQVCAGSTITIHTEGHIKVPEAPVTLSLAELFQILDE